jgi:hypothetical protein
MTINVVDTTRFIAHPLVALLTFDILKIWIVSRSVMIGALHRLVFMGNLKFT